MYMSQKRRLILYGESNSIVNGIYSFVSINSAIGNDKMYILL